MASLVDLATRIGQELKTLREQAVKGIPGDPGPQGPPGGSDEETAARIQGGPLTQAAGDARWTRTADIEVKSGNSSSTNGSIVRVGAYAYVLRSNVNMGIVQGGGSNNENVVGGNFDNVDTSTSNLLNPPTLTGTDGLWNFILSGYDNVANGWAIILNGFHNRVKAGGNHATVSGGSGQTIGNNNYATIGGGTGHNINDGAHGGTIGGGISNTIASNATSTTIAGGSNNIASGFHAAVGGGGRNTASGNASSVVSGGENNIASGAGAVVPGGNDNTASGNYSTAGGRGAVATAHGMRSYGSRFTDPGDAQDSTVIMTRELTGATPGNLSTSGGPLTIPEHTTWAIDGLVVARRTDADDENAAFKFTAMFKRNAGNTASMGGTAVVTPIGANSGNTWTVTVGSTSAGQVNVSCAGEDGKTIRWLATLRIAHVSG